TPKQSAADQDCYQGNGASYRGTADTTLTGRKCQAWSSMAPHQHNWTAEAYPDADLSMNYCRNPSGDPSPWCFTTDPEVRWEYCRLTRCSETDKGIPGSRTGTPVPGVQETSPPGTTVVQDCYQGNGESYRGTAATTLTGRKCQAWSSMAPHEHQWTAEAYPNAYVFDPNHRHQQTSEILGRAQHQLISKETILLGLEHELLQESIGRGEPLVFHH
ncbi:Apolipoprotein(a), partial [Galemys pyrenaicus]